MLYFRIDRVLMLFCRPCEPCFTDLANLFVTKHVTTNRPKALMFDH